MSFESSIVFRRVARIASRVLMAGLLPVSAVMAQLPISFTPGNPPPVLSGSVIPFNHGATGEWGQIYSIKQAPNGTIMFLDSAQSELYALAPNASLPALVSGPGQSGSGSNDCTTLDASGSYWNAGFSFDSDNNLYFGNRYSSLAPFCRVPYDASTSSWNFKNSVLWGPPSITVNGSTEVLNPQDIFIAPCASSCTNNTMYFSTSGAAAGNAIYEVTFNPSTGAIVGTPTAVITSLQDLAASVVVDPAGNVYFTENIYPTPVNQRVPGIREIPAGTTGITCSGSGSEVTQTTEVGNSASFTGIGGIQVDAQGNLYFASLNNSSYNGYVDGVFMIPNEGTPASPNLNWSDTVMISPVTAGHQPFIDSRGLLWIATGGNANWAPSGTLAPTCDATSIQTVDATCLESTVVLWKPGMAELGSAAVGTQTPVQITAYSVPGAGGSLLLTANNSFTENQVVTISVASSSDPLYALNGQGFIVSGTSLSSTQFEISTSLIAGGASGSTSATASPTSYSTVYYTFNQATTPASFSYGLGANNFKAIPNPILNTAATTPGVPTCTAGTAYPAFTPTEETTGNPSTDFSWCTLFLQLNTPTAGLVASDVQMLDASNNAIVGSNTYLSGVGQGAAISTLTASNSYSVASGLNQPQQVAADAQGDTYVADKALKAIESYPAGTNTPTAGTVYGSGLSAPTGVAVDGAGDLYIGDSGNVYEIPYYSGKLQAAHQTKIASGLGTGNLSLAADGMGDVFIADQANAQVVEIVNPQSALLRQSLPPLVTLGAGDFKAPSAIATDNSGNVWVADGTNLWEIVMPYGAATEVLSSLPTATTGLAVDPSGSVFVAGSSGLLWIPYQVTGTSAGLSVNSEVLVAASLGSGPAAPMSVALDGMENVYVDYGSTATAGLSQLSMNSAINLNNSYSEINPAVPYEVDAQLFNLGNEPLMLASFYPNNGSDTITGSTDYSILQAATLSQPPCSFSTGVAAGGSCYFGLQLLAPNANASDTATVTVASNAANVPVAPAGLTLALSADVVTDPRPATAIQLSFAPNTSTTGCQGSTYPGCQTATVTVTSTAGTPSGTVILRVPGSGISQQEQTATLNANGAATFNFVNLSGGAYNALVTYGGEGVLTCSGSNCFAGSAATSTFTIARAVPTLTVGPPGQEDCLSWTQANCAPDTSKVMSYLGTYFVAVATNTWFTASVTSSVGTPTGSVSFLANGNPVDPKQTQNPIIAGGIADFSLTNLPLNAYAVTAQYNGDQNYAPVTFTVPAFQVINPSVEITANPSTVTTKAGTPAQTTLTVMPLVGFSGQVTLECISASLPPYTECTFGYPNSGQGTIGTAGSSPSTIVVTISTNVPVNSGATASIANKAPWALAGLFGLGLLGLIAGRKRCNRYLTMICLTVMLSGAFAGMTSCTNAGYSTPPKAPQVTTKSGSYNVQIIGYNPSTLQQVSLANTPPYTVQLTVQ